MNLNFLFKSNDHIRYENGKQTSGPHGSANRAIKVEPQIGSREVYLVTIYNLDGDHPIWQNNIQMAQKPMRIINKSSDIIELRGFGFDRTGAAFADYGLDIFYKNGSVEKCFLHMFDRKVDIEYLRANNQSLEDISPSANSFAEIQTFLQKWNEEYSVEKKIRIAQKSDELNNKGCEYYNNDDYENAILYFNKALEVMPINDDALKNLKICYKVTWNFSKQKEIELKLGYLKLRGI